MIKNKKVTTSVCLIGYGYWGKKLLPVLQDEFSDVFIVDPVLPRSVNENILSLEEFLNSSDIQAAAIATPEYTHYQLVKDALLANKNVFVEKPLCFTEEQAEELVNLAQAKEKILTVDYTFLFDPAIPLIQKYISQKIGEIKEISSIRNTAAVANKSQVHISDDLATHDLYLYRLLIGEMPYLDKVTRFEQSSDFTQSISFLLTSKKNIPYRCEYSWLKKSPERELRIVGKNGILVWKKGKEKDVVELLSSSEDQIAIETVQRDISPIQRILRIFKGKIDGEVKKTVPVEYTQYIQDVKILEDIRSRYPVHK